MSRFIQGKYTPKNPVKYIGPNLNNIKYRSSWEHSTMRFFDDHPYILKWSSETLSIPYRHPLLNRVKMYIPDFFVIYVDKKGKQHADVWEIKPEKESPWINPNGKYGPKLQAIRLINLAKWTAAIAYCAKRGFAFKLVTEKQLFAWAPKH